MFKKARELYENCGVNVTLVTEDEGRYHFYNTAMMTHQEVFERYLSLIHQTPQAFVTEDPILDAAIDNAGESPCADPKTEPNQQWDIDAVCVDDLDMSVEESEHINAIFETVEYVSAIAGVCSQNLQQYDKVHAPEGLTADERKQIRQDQEKLQRKQARLEARKVLRRKKREELKSKAAAEANTNAGESAKHTNTLMQPGTHPAGACEKTATANKVQKRKQTAVLGTSKHENVLLANESVQKKSKTKNKSAAVRASPQMHASGCVLGGLMRSSDNRSECENSNNKTQSVHRNNTGSAAETANSGDWLSSITKKLSTATDTTIMLRNDPIFAMFANF